MMYTAEFKLGLLELYHVLKLGAAYCSQVKHLVPSVAWCFQVLLEYL